MLKITYTVCQKKEEQRLFFSFFLDLESSGVWADYWHYLKKLLANSIYSSYVPLRVQDNSVYLDVTERFSSAIIDRLFGAALNSLASVSAGKWSWNRRLFPVSSFYIFLCPARVNDLKGYGNFLSFLFSFLFLAIYCQYVCFHREVVLEGFFPQGLFQA